MGHIVFCTRPKVEVVTKSSFPTIIRLQKGLISNLPLPKTGKRKNVPPSGSKPAEIQRNGQRNSAPASSASASLRDTTLNVQVRPSLPGCTRLIPL